MRKILRSMMKWPAVALAITAVAIFSLFEAGLVQISEYVSTDVYMLVRGITTCIFILLLAKYLFGDEHAVGRFSRDALMPGSWVSMRSLAFVISTLLIAVTLTLSPNQTSSYVWFFLHPVWTLALARPVAKIVNIDYRKQILPLLITVAGAILYSYFPSELKHDPEGCRKVIPDAMANFATSLDITVGALFQGVNIVLPLIAGFCFALTNTLTPLCKREYKVTTCGMTIHAAVIGVAAAFLAPYLLNGLGIPSHCLPKEDVNRYSVIAILAALCLAAVVATIFFTQATSDEKTVATASTMDVVIVLFAAGLDALTEYRKYGALTFHGTHSIYRGVALLMIMIGTGISIYIQPTPEDDDEEAA